MYTSTTMRLAATALVSVLFASVMVVQGAPVVWRRDQLCNGHSELCERKYGNTTFLGAHDSFADSGNFFALARTQEVDVEHQLTAGVRALQLQAHKQSDGIHFCHTSCMLFDGGLIQNYFHKVNRFLTTHPNEVLTIIIANPESIPVKDYIPAFNASGLTALTYTPPQPIMSRDDWPTLGSMIASTHRVVIFMDKGAEARTELGPGEQFVLPQFQMMWEDKYDPTDAHFPCKVDRTQGPLAPNQQLNLINHNLNTNILPIGRGVLIPDRLDSRHTNSIDEIEMHAAHCSQYTDEKRPNFVLLDFVNVGEGLTAVDMLNGFEL